MGMIGNRLSRRRAEVRAGRNDGFTLIELLVVIVILGILASVVVFAVRGLGDRGEADARAIDARTIRTAQETYCAQNGRYADADELVPDFLSNLPVYNQTQAVPQGTADATGNCIASGDLDKASYLLTCDASQSGCGGGGALALEWQVQMIPSGVGRLNDIAFTDTQHGWAVGSGGTILATQDGGENWGRQTSGTTADLQEVDFTDSLNGWAVGGSRILATEDGGQSWEDRTPSTPGLGASAVDFVDSERGWVGGMNGLIISTVNGGTDWSVSRPDDLPGVGTILALRFVDDGSGSFSRGFAVGEPFDSFGNFDMGYLTTDDGGATWLARDLSETIETFLFDIAFVGETHGWAVGIGLNNMFGSVDGGQTWERQPSAPSNRSAVNFVNERQGWAVGLGGPGGTGTVISTTDGGSTWTIQPTPSLNGLNGVDFVDSAHGWAVGNNLILSYSTSVTSP